MIERDCTAGVLFDGELDIEVAGLGNHDILEVLGAIHFGTNASIKFIFEGYMPQQGDAFRFSTPTSSTASRT